MKSKTLFFVGLGMILLLLGVFAASPQKFPRLPNDPYRDTINAPAFKANNPLYSDFRGTSTWYVYGRCLEAGWKLTYSGTASDWYSTVSNGSNKDFIPSVGSIMCMPNHVAYVTSVAPDGTTWVVDEYNYAPRGHREWDEQTFRKGTYPGLVYSEARQAWVTLSGFIHPPLLPDGLYRATDEDSVYLVTNGRRRAIPSEDCFVDWHLKASDVLSISAAQLYTQTSWEAPIAHLVRMHGSSKVYWIQELVGAQPMDGHFFARPIVDEDVFHGMGFSSADVRTVNYNPVVKYPKGGMLWTVEPYLVVQDGPFALMRDGKFWVQYRIKNLSDSPKYPFATTVRAYRTPQQDWFDFPWTSARGLSPGQVDGWSPDPTSTWLQSGSFRMKVICRYQNPDGYLQVVLPHSGDLPHPLDQDSFTY